MKAILLLVLLGASACNIFQSASDNTPLITPEHLTQKNLESTFETYSYEEHPFRNWSINEIKSLLGVSSLALKDTSNVDKTSSSDLPSEFDSRTQWPNCIHPIRDQGKCGSCWAHAASEVLSDRFCIASKGALNVILSPQDMVSCDYLDHGCNGGIPDLSWFYLQHWGIVSDECKPYTAGTGHVDSCKFFTHSCRSDGAEYKKYKASKFYNLSSVNEIKKNLVEHGPVETGFSVYDDFMSYKSGVYKKGPGARMLGGHAVKIIGWGNEDETDYWLVANSWSEKWGIDGYFKIAFGQCGIENCTAGEPAL